jgi:hypothetical protein
MINSKFQIFIKYQKRIAAKNTNFKKEETPTYLDGLMLITI